MKIILISDTHGRHRDIDIPMGDMIIHAGDFSGRGKIDEIRGFFSWFGRLPHPHKVCIAGNHDFLAEKEPEVFKTLIPEGVVYLENEGKEVAGIKIWGSPITPWFYDWAFNRHRGEEIRPYWEKIPADTEILVTHGPPYGILDRCEDGKLAGCEELSERLTKITPKLHVFGHIHEAYGIHSQDGCTFVNASSLNLRYYPVHAPVIFEWEK